MGPAATTAFLARVQALTPATGDEDHIRIIAVPVPAKNRPY
jgi:aspartate racemase